MIGVETFVEPTSTVVIVLAAVALFGLSYELDRRGYSSRQGARFP